MGLNKTSVAGKSRCATLAGGGGGRPAWPSPSAASPRLRHRAQEPRAAPASGGLGPGAPRPQGRRLAPPPRGDRDGNAGHEGTGDADGGAGRATGAGRSGDVGPARVRGRAPLATPPPERRRGRWSRSPRPGVGTPLAPRPSPYSLTFLEACALPSSGGRSPEHVRGGCGAVSGTGSQALQQAAPPSPGSAPLRSRCHLVLAAERKRRNTLPRPLLLLLWLLSAGPVSLIFLPGDLGWGRLG